MYSIPTMTLWIYGFLSPSTPGIPPSSTSSFSLFGLESGYGTLHYMYIRIIISRKVYWNDYVIKWICPFRFNQACTWYEALMIALTKKDEFNFHVVHKTLYLRYSWHKTPYTRKSLRLQRSAHATKGNTLDHRKLVNAILASLAAEATLLDTSKPSKS